jgi:hypothetical protein
MEHRARTLIHTAWFDFALQRLGGAERMDEVLGRELYRLSLFAEKVPVIPHHEPLRIYRTSPFVRDDGHLVRLWIYFNLPDESSVELQHIEALEEDMEGAS